MNVGPIAMLPSTEDLIELAGAEIPETIADRVDSGGLSTGEAARMGARGSSWTQTVIHVGSADITDPVRGGTTLLVPRPEQFERLDVISGMMPVEVNAPGLAMLLSPRRPADMWLGSIALAGAWPGLNLQWTARAPAIARVDTWFDGALSAGGPLSDRSGLFITAGGTRSTRFEREQPTKLDADVASVFAHARTGRPSDAIGIIAWAERARHPFANRIAFGQPSAGERSVALHAQLGWNHAAASSPWTTSAFAAVTAGDRRNDLAPQSAMVTERLTDGPVPELLSPGTDTSRTWSMGIRVGADSSQSRRRHALVAGFQAEGSSADVRAAFDGRIGELLNGVPARVWDFTSPSATSTPSTWSSTSVALFASDRMALGERATVDAGVRFESVHGSAAGAARGVSWNDVWPRLGVRVGLTDRFSTSAFAHVATYGHRLPLADLAWGDPSAPVGRVSLWTPSIVDARPGRVPAPPDIGPLVARVGPGTGGTPSFSAIDPSLRRPRMDEVVTGIEGKPSRWSTARLVAIARRERNLIGAVDVGVPESSYAVAYIPDPGVDLFGGSTEQLLPVYNRDPLTFGADRYLLTNPPDAESTFVGGELTFETQTEHLYLLMGATAGRSEIIAASRGFGPLENDNGVVGEAFIDPNARTFAQGRPFTERGYTLKWSGAYRWNTGAAFGLVARYEDGEHFSRLVIVPDLNQGAEAVRAFRSGKTRFTFINTLDARYQQPIRVGSHTVVASADVYNLLNTPLEIEEFSVTGPLSRKTTAVQPPLAVHFRLTIPF